MNARAAPGGIDLDAIRQAARRIAPEIWRTPVHRSSTLEREVGAPVVLKCENLQKTGSFKPRGALNVVLGLTPAERARGLCTVSAGNHAQAVAWAAARLGVPCTVVMPEGAPRVKQEAVRGYRAEIVLHADRATLFDRLAEVRAETGAHFVHPFDDPIGLAGAGTLGLEIVEQVPDVGVVVVPVGGGGLMAGVTSAVKAMRPECRVIAVELGEGPGMGPALAAGRPVPVSRPAHTLADGLASPFVGARPLAVAQTLVDTFVSVSEDEIRSAMRFLIERAKLVVEGAGAVATAALRAGKVTIDKGPVVAVVSGGNLDLSRLGELASFTSETKPAPRP
jgi:threonine dehydratase